MRLPQNYGLWLTNERYLTVDGAGPIHERGLRPTVGVAIPTVAFDEVPPTTDEPLEQGGRAAERPRSRTGLSRCYTVKFVAAPVRLPYTTVGT